MHEITEVAWSNAPQDRPGTLLVIALHGRGSDEASMIGIRAQMPPGVTVAALRGPVTLDFGYTWFENRGIGRPIEESIQASSDAVFAWLDSVAAQHTGVVVLGFSGGTAMGGGLLFAHPEKFDAGILLSGTLPWDAGFDTRAERWQGKPILWSIDANDQVIPRDLVERSEAWLLEESGAVVTVVPIPGVGHAFDADQLVAIREFVARFAPST